MTLEPLNQYVTYITLTINAIAKEYYIFEKNEKAIYDFAINFALNHEKLYGVVSTYSDMTDRIFIRELHNFYCHILKIKLEDFDRKTNIIYTRQLLKGYKKDMPCYNDIYVYPSYDYRDIFINDELNLDLKPCVNIYAINVKTQEFNLYNKEIILENEYEDKIKNISVDLIKEWTDNELSDEKVDILSRYLVRGLEWDKCTMRGTVFDNVTEELGIYGFKNYMCRGWK